MKRIVIDTYPIAEPYSGLGEFCKQLGVRLSKRAHELRTKHGIELYFLMLPKFKGCFGDDVNYICVPASFRKLMPIYPFKADLLHIPYQCSKVKGMYLAKKQLLTIHDINFIYEREGKRLTRAANKFKQRVKWADYVSYISMFACKDSEKHFNIQKPKKIIYNGVTNLSETAKHTPLPDTIPGNFLFHISSLLPKKNVHLLVEMMEFLPEQNLVIAGNWHNDYAHMLKKRIKESGAKNIYILPNITEGKKAALYAACRALLFPSLCEGFGLPPIEAMKFGKPVFLSTLTSLPEIGGEEAFYWEELVPQKMAEVVRTKLAVFDASESYAERLIKNSSRFDWDNCVTEYLNYYLEILGE